MAQPVLITFALLVGLGAGAWFLGALFAAALRVPLLQKRSPEAFLATLVAGFGLLMLSCGWGAYAGLTAPRFIWVVPCLAVLLLGIALVRRSGVILPRLSTTFGLIVAALAGRAVCCLLPLLQGSTLSPFNDGSLYLCVAESLQTSDFSTRQPVDDAFPARHQLTSFQDMGHRIGPVFLLAGLRAALPGLNAFDVYPAVLAWGAILNMAAIGLLCRWGFRLPRRPTLVGLGLAAITPDSLMFACQHGFVCQIYGTAVLGTALALLIRVHPPSQWRAGNAWLLGLIAAMQLSAYSELAPILFGAALGWVLVNVTYGYRAIRFVIGSLLAAALLGNIEFVRVWTALHVMTQLQGVGFPISWETSRYFSFALTAGPMSWPMILPFKGAPPNVILIGSLILAVLGLLSLMRWRRRQAALLAAMLCFGGLFLWFRYVSRSPWSGEIGHPWNLLKIAKWFYPIGFSLKIAGLAIVWRWTSKAQGRPSLGFACLGFAALLTMAWFYLLVQERTSKAMIELQWHSLAEVAHPHEEFGRLQRRIAEIAPASIWYVAAPGEAHPLVLYRFAFTAIPFQAAWMYDPELRTVLIQHGSPPFEEPFERLPFNASRMDPRRPVFFAVTQGTTLIRHRVGESGIGIDERPIYLEFNSPRLWPGSLKLTYQWRGGGSTVVRVSMNDLPPIEMVLAAGEVREVSLPVLVTLGIGRIKLQSSSDHRLDAKESSLRLLDARIAAD